MRTPSMTTQEAEAVLGPRGSLVVNADNKGTVKKWLTAHGLPGLYVSGLSYSILQWAYNDATNARLETLRAEAKASATEDGNDGKDVPGMPIVPQSNGHDTNPAILEALKVLVTAANVAPKAPEAAPIDAEAVRAILRAELPSLIPTTKLEIKIADATHVLEKPRHKLMTTALNVVSQNIPLLLVGPAGGGKSTAGEQIAECLSLPFYLQGAASGTHEYIGYKDGAGQYHTTPFRKAFEEGGLFMAEELDSGSPDVPLILNAGLANGHMAFPDSPVPIKRHSDFRIIANANTYGNGADRIYVGRTQLDGATIDRFAFIDWNYDEDLERQLVANGNWLARVHSLRASAMREKARIIISPRASINGAKLLAAGIDQPTVETMTIWKGCETELRRRIETGARAAM